MFLTQELASLAVALLAGWAALVTCVPGEPTWKRWVPVLPLALWLATLGRHDLMPGQCGLQFERGDHGNHGSEQIYILCTY